MLTIEHEINQQKLDTFLLFSDHDDIRPQTEVHPVQAQTTGQIAKILRSPRKIIERYF